MNLNEKWDKRFLELARLVSTWSKDPSTKTGAVIVRPDRTIVSLGYNGFPKNMDDSPKLYVNREDKYSRIVHCEINSILNAKQSVEYCTLYTWPLGSCERCAVQVIQSGIKRCVFPKLPKKLKKRWDESLRKTFRYFTEAGVSWVEI